ncbi:snaclec subunit A-like [Bradysia coprophila]|uniref:snaclec subunit A-like n=1 Tax=Bradysia coprophila TaxID=38358 RepID=UPI00187DD0BD|nr:snaclec subunit A-like [Bradysia coprophila]
MANIVLCLAIICIIATSIVRGFDVSDLCGDDWVPFEDEKCVRVFPIFANRIDAERRCNDEDGTLVIIKTATEQMFIRELVLNATTNVWIGAERRPGSETEYIWNDGSAVHRFTYWQPGSPIIGDRRDCVIMRRDIPTLSFQWTNIACSTSSGFICEKKQIWPFEYLQEAILDARRTKEHSVLSFIDQLADLTTKLNRTNTELKHLQDNPVPLGFVYTQLPDQPAPWILWYTVEWTEITTTLGAVPETGSIQAAGSPLNVGTRFWTRTK